MLATTNAPLLPILEAILKSGQLAVWPHERLNGMPEREGLRELAERVRAAVMGPDHLEDPLDIESLCDLGGFEVKETVLHGAEGRLQALLFPRPRNRFSVLVDPEPPGGWHLVEPQIKSDLREHRMRFRVCHEIAHTFFFDRDRDTPRATVSSSEAQEAFCDQFASELLIPRSAVAKLAASAGSIVDVQRNYRVSLEAAARAFAETHPETRVCIYLDRPDQARALQWSSGPTESQDLSAVIDAAPRNSDCDSIVRLADRHQTLIVSC